MKHKAAIITFICLAVLSLTAVGVFLFNPTLAGRLIASVSVVQTPTQAPTEPATQPSASADVQALQAEKTPGALKRGETLALNPVIVPANAKNRELSFTSSNPNVASVDSTGKVTALSAGECTITAVASANKKATAEYKLTITDERIDEIKLLNDYLLEIPSSRKVSYGDKKTQTVNLVQCRITNQGTDGHYVLLLKYQIGASITAVEVVTLQNGKPVSLKTFESFSSLLEQPNTSYSETVCTGETSAFYIKSTAIQNSGTQGKRTVTLYSTSSGTLSSVQTMTDVYRYKDGENVPLSGTFSIDGGNTTEETYLSALSALGENYPAFTDWANRTITVAQGKYEKAQPVVRLEEVYLNRIEWTTSDKAVAAVNKNGVVTGKNAGSCEVQGVLSCLSGAVCSVQVTVRSNSEALSRYLDSIKDQTIQAENGTALALYASKAIDADGDGTNELLLYYTGGRSCQIDIAKETGGEIKRSTAFFAATDSSKTCRLDIYMDNTTGNVVLCENYVSENGASQTTEFSFNAYKDGKYTADSQTYKIVANGSGEENAAYYIDGQKVKKDAFDLATGHYGQYAQWDINK
ncbi:MAG TPA: Ig-like domain-containing protein [Candidatus Scatavimonas merdigallinarum]|uniref:Ig-like domain-containing protein n=1 Tax=Candidatus Scatavimonas merdigallinarum TaxID=2840914 RepID=A0A9D0ZIB0_9FIRM|nr:Ig-like domain-containing protein [Candidatus Scatavimonas merdigallinarum]